jgi:hypothetical protein
MSATRLVEFSSGTRIGSLRFNRLIGIIPAMGSHRYRHPKEWLEIEEIRPIGFIGKDILPIEKKITDPSEIIKQNQEFEISRLLLNQPRKQEQHPGIDR